MKLQGPVIVEIKVGITNGEDSGEATIRLGHGTYPSEAEMRHAVDKLAAFQLPAGFRLMSKREWWDTIVPPQFETDEDGEPHKTAFAMPGSETEWDA